VSAHSSIRNPAGLPLHLRSRSVELRATNIFVRMVKKLKYRTKDSGIEATRFRMSKYNCMMRANDPSMTTTNNKNWLIWIRNDLTIALRG